MLKRLIFFICVFLLVFSVGCSNHTEEASSDAVSNSQKSETSTLAEDNDAIDTESNNTDSSEESDSAEDNDDADTQSNIPSSKSKYAGLTNEVVLPLDGDYNISLEDAVEIAFEEAKKYEDEYGLIIDDDAISDYTCEVIKKNDQVFYDIIFKNLPLKNYLIRSQIGIWVDVDSGEVINVSQYK